MDKYDIIFIFDFISNKLFNLLDKRKDFKSMYYKAKKEWLLHKYYILRTRRSAKYKKNQGVNIHHGIEKAFILDRRKRYMWEMLKPMSRQYHKDEVL